MAPMTAMLGHASADTTGKYVHPALDEIAKAVEGRSYLPFAAGIRRSQFRVVHPD